MMRSVVPVIASGICWGNRHNGQREGKKSHVMHPVPLQGCGRYMVRIDRSTYRGNMKHYRPYIRSETEHMIACLRERDDKLCQDAAKELERMRDERLTLSHRIHQQRVALRDNWMIIEMRAQYARAWYPSPLLKSVLRDRWKQPPWWRRIFT